jgi:STE24 endopeptidase
LPRLLVLFLVLRVLQHAIERGLAALNHRYTNDPARRAEVARLLGISDAEMDKAIAYARDRYRFGAWASTIELLAALGFIVLGGLGAVDDFARRFATGTTEIGVGLVFYGILGLLTALFELPFSIYSTFVIEEKHGFNRQTLGGFFLDRVKGLILAAALGGPILGAILGIMQWLGPSWWLWAWGAVTVFTLFTAWIYPTLLAPLFNKFTPLPPGEPRSGIEALAARLGFRTGGVFVMDASRRTAHGNAYFTGLFRQKRIVLFDTLLEAMQPPEVLAVLAHELGHFKLHHVRWALLRSTLHTGLVFWLLSQALPLSPFYRSFGLAHSPHAALVVFGLWLGLLEFLLQPLQSAFLRRHEFAADNFALRAGACADDLSRALLKLREKSRLLPFSHPLYSRVYHSHPPLVERLAALRSTS